MTHCGAYKRPGLRSIILCAKESDTLHTPLSYNNSIMSSIKHWVLELAAEIVATYVLSEVRISVPELFVTLPENPWDLTDWLKEAGQFLLRKTVTYVLCDLASVIHKRIVGGVVIHRPYRFRHKKTFSKPTVVVVV